MNILFLSAGRRVELIKLFRKTAEEMHISSRFVAADIFNTAPAIYFADTFYLIPRIGEEGYLESIEEICQKEDIRLIIPTIDTELRILAEHREEIESQTNAKLLVSDTKVIEVCRDKKKTAQFLTEHGFLTPKVYKENDVVSFPAFIKPADGSSSINAFKVNNEKEFLFFKDYIKNPIVQEFVEGEEYTVDCFLDFHSQIISIVPRLRIQVRSGEILKGRICKDKDIIEATKQLLSVLKPIGQIAIQCMKTKRGIVFIEINPRFGGGSPMSIKAGANSCQNLYLLLQGKTLAYDESYRDGLTFSRFDDSICLDETMNPISI